MASGFSVLDNPDAKGRAENQVGPKAQGQRAGPRAQRSGLGETLTGSLTGESPCSLRSGGYWLPVAWLSGRPRLESCEQVRHGLLEGKLPHCTNMAGVDEKRQYIVFESLL